MAYRELTIWNFERSTRIQFRKEGENSKYREKLEISIFIIHKHAMEGIVSKMGQYL